MPPERFAVLKQVSNDIKTLEEELKKFEAAQEALLMTIPNLLRAFVQEVSKTLLLTNRVEAYPPEIRCQGHVLFTIVPD